MGKRWNRKRKQEEAIKKSSKPRQEKDGNNEDANPYLITSPTNAKMEAYYAYQGLHHRRHVGSTGTFKMCDTDEEKEEERLRFMETLSSILPVSFRIGQNVEEGLREELVKDLDGFVGKEVEILVSVDGRNYNKRRSDTNATNNNNDGNTDTAASVEPETNETETKRKTNPSEREVETFIKKIAPAKKVPYIPNAYQLSVDRRTLRRNPKLEEFHDWMKIQTEAGFVTRQETVSMIPPVVLAPEPHHHILDMCAAPGSKTSQLLEVVNEIPPNSNEPTGFVVANDSDAKRAYMLVHQLRRLNSPASFLTCVDAQFWPAVHKHNQNQENQSQEGIFDRVLCDVPCSGDGTARKNPGIWRRWSVLGALGLHPLQLSIVLNGARLTKVGGYICYSTCSMNPIENEAVVAELLRLTEGSLELVDRSKGTEGGVGAEGSMGEGFWAREGWTTWKVLNEAKTRKLIKNENKKRGQEFRKRKKEWEAKEEERKKKAEEEGGGEGETATSNKEPERTWADEVADMKAEYRSQKEAREPWIASPPSWDEETLRQRAESTGMELYRSYDDVPETQRRRCRESCFPPTPEEVKKFKLERCMRCLPHDMDTGGFFVALFRKVAPLNERAKKKAKALALDSRPDADEDGVGCGRVNGDDGDDEDDPKTDGKTEADPIEKSVTVDDAAAASAVAADAGDTIVTGAAVTDVESKVTITFPKNTKLVNGKPLQRRCGKSRGNQGNYDFVPLDDTVLPPLIDFYGLSDSFARGQFMARNSGGVAKLLYFITASVKKNLLDIGVQDRVTVVTSGLRAFERESGNGIRRYRPCQESIHFIAPHMTKRKIIANLADFKNCLRTGFIKSESFSEAMAKEIKSLSVGAFVVALEGYETNVVKKMFLTMWRCRGEGGTVNCLMSKTDQGGMKSKVRAFGEDGNKDESAVVQDESEKGDV